MSDPSSLDLLLAFPSVSSASKDRAVLDFEIRNLAGEDPAAARPGPMLCASLPGCWTRRP